MGGDEATVANLKWSYVHMENPDRPLSVRTRNLAFEGSIAVEYKNAIVEEINGKLP